MAQLKVGQSKYQEGIIGDFYTRNITARTEIEFFGDWERVSTILHKLPMEVRVTTHKAIRSYTDQYLSEIKKAISSGRIKGGKEFKKYSDGYRRYKLREGTQGYESFFRLHGNLVQSIRIQDDGKKLVRVTVDKNGPTSKEGLNPSQLMNVLEHGSVSRNISARPLFGPVWAGMGGNKALNRFVSNELGNTFKKYR